MDELFDCGLESSSQNEIIVLGSVMRKCLMLGGGNILMINEFTRGINTIPNCTKTFDKKIKSCLKIDFGGLKKTSSYGVSAGL